MQYLDKNTEGNNDWARSFIGRLSEDWIWEENEFWLLHAEITRYASDNAEDDVISKDIASRISRIFYLVMLLYSAHKDPEDVFRVKNISDERLGHLIERIEWLLKCFFSGEISNEEDFYVRNPHL